MADYEKAVKQILSEYECYFVRHGKGDHDIWYSPLTNARFPVDGAIKSRHSANGILKRAGIAHKF